MTAGPLAVPGDLADWRADDGELALDAAGSIVRGYCGWHIAPSLTETVTVDGSEGYFIMLPTLWLTAVEDLVVAGDPVEFDPDLVKWSRNGYLWRSQGWSWRYQSVTVTMTHGYAQVPDEVRAVVVALADSLSPALSGATAVRVDDGYVSYGAEQVSTMQRAILDRYRIPKC